VLALLVSPLGMSDLIIEYLTGTDNYDRFAIGIVGDAGVRGTAQQPRLFVGMILILIFAEVLGLYGLIVALLMNAKVSGAEC
jgi:hypothetical protein